MTPNFTLLYIDPGTGSLLISTVIGISLTLLFTLRGFFYRILAQLSGKSYQGKSNFPDALVFFSEGKNYWNVFKPVLLELISQKEKFVYLTADKDDPALKLDSEYCDAHFIGNIKQAIITLNSLKAKMCVMTTPQLNVITLKRSKYVQHYCHLIHSPTDIHAYKKFAFDYFDSVLCSSTFQIDNLRLLEKNRHSQTKLLLETGCTYLDAYKEKIQGEADAILIAPTWGEKSFFSSCGEELIGRLLEGGYNIIFRPHPQSWISDKDLLKQILARFGDNTSFIVDKTVDNSGAISKSKLMICDMSGMVYDFAFMQRKPVIAIDFEWDNGGYEASDIQNPTSTSYLLEDIGQFISTQQVEHICPVVESALDKSITDEIIDKHIFNFKKATPIAVEQIISIYRQLKA